MLDKLKLDFITILINLKVVSASKDESDNKVLQKKVSNDVNKKIGRNEPCSCGSGKKYKHCCGRL